MLEVSDSIGMFLLNCTTKIFNNEKISSDT